MKEAIKDFAFGSIAMLFVGLVVGGTNWLASKAQPLNVDMPVWVGLTLIIFSLFVWTYFLGRFLRGK